MSNFQFELGQRVTMPGEPNVQGVVSSRMEFIGQQNEYHVHWMLPDLKTAHLLTNESVLLAAQPPKVDLNDILKPLSSADVGTRGESQRRSKRKSSRKKRR